jgi:di/tricarboxylate transporter
MNSPNASVIEGRINSSDRSMIRIPIFDARGIVSFILVAFVLALASVLIIRKLHKPNAKQEAVSEPGRNKRNSGASEFNIYRIFPYALLALGLVSLITSAFSGLYVPAFIGLGLAF